MDTRKGTSTNARWLAQVVEEPLDPDLPICDPHHHFWLTRPYGVQPRYMLEDFLGDIEESGHNVVSSVFVTCAAMLRKDVPKHLEVIGETEFVNGIAAIGASGALGGRLFPAAIVGTAYLRMHEAVPEVLDMHLARGGDRFKGIRESAPWDASPDIPKHRTNPPPKLLMDVDFRRGFAHLAPRRLSFEALINYPQLPDLIDLASTFPDTLIVLNHLGYPLGVGPYAGRSDEVFAEWSRLMAELAKRPNVTVKLGGMQMEHTGYGWHRAEKPPTSDALVEATRHFYDTAIELFGIERCMFESNFPVDKLGCSYGVLWNAFKKMTKGYSADERTALFSGTAGRIYRL